MPPSGQQLLEESIAACREIADGLSEQNQAWEKSVAEIIEKFEEVSGTFFFKTMVSVPATRATSRDAAAALELRRKEDWGKFEPALGQLIKSAQELINKSGMQGVTLT